MNKTMGWVLSGIMVAISTGVFAADTDCKLDEKYRPKLFKQFGNHVNVPDGMAQDKAGNIYLAAPNFVDKSYPGTIMKMDKKSGKEAGTGRINSGRVALGQAVAQKLKALIFVRTRTIQFHVSLHGPFACHDPAMINPRPEHLIHAHVHTGQ